MRSDREANSAAAIMVYSLTLRMLFDYTGSANMLAEA